MAIEGINPESPVATGRASMPPPIQVPPTKKMAEISVEKLGDDELVDFVMRMRSIPYVYFKHTISVWIPPVTSTLPFGLR